MDIFGQWSRYIKVWNELEFRHHSVDIFGECSLHIVVWNELELGHYGNHEEFASTLGKHICENVVIFKVGPSMCMLFYKGCFIRCYSLLAVQVLDQLF